MTELLPLKILPDEKDVDVIAAERIRACAERRGPLKILEAGCGRRWPYQLEGVTFNLTGVDTDETALRIRRDEKGDLDDTIVGDLRTVEFPDASFDIIYSAYVLEHIVNVEAVLKNFAAWLKPGGLMILKFPDRDSVYGFVTRSTPLFVHVAYKRYLGNRPNYGKPGHGPYPTFHEPIIGRGRFEAFARDKNLTAVDAIGYGLLPRYQQLGTQAFAALSFGKLTAQYYNLAYVLSSAADQPADAPAG